MADDWYSGMYGSWISGNKAGLEEGLAKGIDQTNKKIARKMILAGQPDSLISEFTGLSLEQISHLKN